MSLRLSALLAATLLVAACVPAARGGAGGPTGPNEALAGLPPLTDPPLALDDDDDLQRARGLFDALADDDPARAARRAELWKAYQQQIEIAMGRIDIDGAAEALETAIRMC